MKAFWSAVVSVVLILGAASSTNIDFQIYHTTDALLEFYKTTAAQHPSLLRYVQQVLKLDQLELWAGRVLSPKGECRYDIVPDSKTDDNLPLVTITDFTADAKKEVVSLVAGEHPSDLITAELLFWLAHVLTGQGEELTEWAAFQPVQAAAWKSGWTTTTLAEWATTLLKRVEFRVCSTQL